MTRSDSPADLSQEDEDELPKEVPTVPPPTGGGDAYSAATVVKTVSSELLEKAREQREKRPVPAAGAPAAPSSAKVASAPVAPSAPRVASAPIAPSPVRVAAAASVATSASAPRDRVAEKVPSEPPVQPAQVVVSLSEEKDETVEGGTQVMPETRQREAALIAYAQTSRVTPPANADEPSAPVARPAAQAPTSSRVWVPILVVAVLLLLALFFLKR